MDGQQTRLQLRIMTEDRSPIPPVDDQGLPPRPAPYQPIPGNVQFARCKLQPGQDVPLIAMVYDDPVQRVVTYWAEDAFIQLARSMLRFAGAPSLTIADIDDLRDLNKLKDARPFMEGK